MRGFPIALEQRERAYRLGKDLLSPISRRLALEPRPHGPGAQAPATPPGGASLMAVARADGSLAARVTVPNRRNSPSRAGRATSRSVADHDDVVGGGCRSPITAIPIRSGPCRSRPRRHPAGQLSSIPLKPYCVRTGSAGRDGRGLGSSRIMRRTSATARSSCGSRPASTAAASFSITISGSTP